MVDFELLIRQNSGFKIFRGQAPLSRFVKMKAGQNVSGKDTLVVTKFLGAENSWDRIYLGQYIRGIKCLLTVPQL